jgi:hypothetical protein
VDPACTELLFSMLKQIAFVWHPNLFVTAAIAKTQRKVCEFRKKHIAHFHARSFGLSNFEQIQSTTFFLVTTEKTVFLPVKVTIWNEIQRFPKT